jgi:hypothetical protein
LPLEGDVTLTFGNAMRGVLKVSNHYFAFSAHEF